MYASKRRVCSLSYSQKLSFPVWGGLTAFLQGVLLCVQHNKFMITDSEPITTKLKVRGGVGGEEHERVELFMRLKIASRKMHIV